MSVEVNIIAHEKNNALLVPSDSIQDSVLFIVEDDVARRRQVEIGIRGARQTEILAGVGAGERVIAPFKAELKDGARVHAKAAPAAL